MTVKKFLRSESASRLVWRAQGRFPFKMPCVGSVDVQVEDIQRAVVPYQDLAKAPIDMEWDWNTGAQNDVLGDTEDWDRYKRAHVWYDPEGGDVKSSFKLPVARMVDGELKVVWRGVAAAMGALMGARGGVDIPDSQRKQVYDVLAQHYESFDKEPPEFRSKDIEARSMPEGATGSIIYGVASSTSKDWHGTEMSRSALSQMANQFNKGVPYLPSHGEDEWDEIIGRTIGAEVMPSKLAKNPEGGSGYDLRVTVQLYEDEEKANKLMKRLSRGELIGMSVGGWFTELDMIENKETSEVEQVIVRGVELDHLATTRRPSNPDSWITEVRSKGFERGKNGVYPFDIGQYVMFGEYCGQVVEIFGASYIIDDVENGPFKVDEMALRVRLYDKPDGDSYGYKVTDRHRAVEIRDAQPWDGPIPGEMEQGETAELSSDSVPDVTSVEDSAEESRKGEDALELDERAEGSGENLLDKESTSGQDTHVCDAHRSASTNNAEDYKEITAMSEEKTQEVAQEHAQDPNVGSRLDALERSIEKITDLMVRMAEPKQEEVKAPEVDEKDERIASLNRTVSDLESKVLRLCAGRKGTVHRHTIAQARSVDQYDQAILDYEEKNGAGALSSVVRSQKESRMEDSMHSSDLQRDLAEIINAALADGLIENPFA
jgi:phage head maturation protease